LIKIVRHNPGIHYRELLRMSGLGNGTLQYQLALLERLGILRADRSSGFTRYYNSDVSKADMKLLHYLKQRPYAEIIRLLLDDPSGTFSFAQVVHRMGKAPSTVSVHLSELIDRKLVRFDEKRGYTVNNKRAITRLISEYRV
jgi:predicted transcriptional regulator